jgi:hypothetical protein
MTNFGTRRLDVSGAADTRGRLPIKGASPLAAVALSLAGHRERPPAVYVAVRLRDDVIAGALLRVDGPLHARIGGRRPGG